MKAHVLPGIVLKSDVKPGAVAVKSLLTASEPGTTVKLELEKDGDIEVDGGVGDMDLVGFDLTFDGVYQPGGPYVVHAVEGVVLPPGTPLEKKKKDKGEGSGEKKSKGAEDGEEGAEEEKDKKKKDKKDKKKKEEAEGGEGGEEKEKKKDKKKDKKDKKDKKKWVDPGGGLAPQGIRRRGRSRGRGRRALGCRAHRAPCSGPQEGQGGGGGGRAPRARCLGDPNARRACRARRRHGRPVRGPEREGQRQEHGELLGGQGRRLWPGAMLPCLGSQRARRQAPLTPPHPHPPASPFPRARCRRPAPRPAPTR
jgi:hypothetical protein